MGPLEITMSNQQGPLWKQAVLNMQEYTAN